MIGAMTTSNTGIVAAPFPAPSKTIVSEKLGVEVTGITFNDKYLVTISQNGRINHWSQVPLTHISEADIASINMTTNLDESTPDSSLLPHYNLTASTLFGGTKPDLELLGHTFANTLATTLLMRGGEQTRTLVVGLGLTDAKVEKENFDELLGLCMSVI